MFLDQIAFALLFCALGTSLWQGALPRLSLGLAGMSLIMAGLGQTLNLNAIPALLTGALILAAKHYTPSSHDHKHKLILIAAAIWALCAGLHLWQGFSPLRWMEHFGRNNQPLQWNYDKALGGLLLLHCLPRIHHEEKQNWRWLGVLLTGVLCLLLTTMLMGFARFAPLWPDGMALWLAGNLFLTVFAEEAFFRGFIQGSLIRLLASRTPHAYPIALGISSVLFALVHLPWGIAFSAMALLAGLFYGTMAGRTLHLDRAITAHFLTNASIALCLHSPLA